MLTALPSISQTISIKENRIKAIVTDKGDTSILIPYEDAKYILSDLLVCEETEKESFIKDTLILTLNNKIALLDTIILKDKELYDNCNLTNINCVKVIDNQKSIINELRAQVRKEKRNKIIAIIGGGLLTILAILAF
jgi:hypothetical protein